MKQFKNTVLVYTVFMIAALLILVTKVRSFTFNAVNVDAYSDEELKIYKTVKDNISTAVDEGRDDILLLISIVWLVLLIGGYLLFYVFYRTQIKPIKELEAFATEIAKGNLDIALPIRRQSSSFTESFDLMREQLKASKEREIASERAKREMVAELSHDLKTPVATIKATCEVLEMIYRRKLEMQATAQKGQISETESILEKIGYISAKIETINKLVENVFRANLDDMEEITVNVTECGSGIIRGFFEGMKDYGNIIMDNDIPECLVYLDKLRMEQVIDNVVGNSFKYAGTDIHVSFALSKVSPSSGGSRQFIEITIKDSGPGVPEDELPLIVEKYYRGKNTADKTGYGLGLHLVKTYMEKQGGGMEYYNDNGFTVKLYVLKV